MTAQASVAREVVRYQFESFVRDTVARLEQFGIADTPLQEAWTSVVAVQEDEHLFCSLAGALGVDPRDVSDQLASLITELHGLFGEQLLLDLCRVSTAGSLAFVAENAKSAWSDLKTAPTADLRPLGSVTLPADRLTTPAWRRGINAANHLRQHFHIADTDPKGASQVFERLSLKVGRDSFGKRQPSATDSEGIVVGAISRDMNEARVALLQPHFDQRRFWAARGVFAAWSSEPADTHFLTSAVTRDQQANRAFAAELTAPIALLKKRATRMKLTQDQVFDLAAELEVGADVVSKQALNNGLQVTAG
jgi:hypothetical protein